MSKIPVIRTVAYAYSFTFGQLGSVIATAWLPMLVLAAASYLVAVNTYPPLIAALESGIFGGMGSLLGLMLVWIAVMIVLYSVIYVALTRLALGLPMKSGLVRVSLGAAEWRGVGSILALALIAFLFLIAYSLLLRTATTMPAGGGVVALLAAFAVYLAMIFCVVRLGFLMFPANAAEGAGLARSWELTAGNFWRIFAVVLLTALPLSCAFVLAEYAVLGSDYFLPPPAEGASAPAAMARQIQMTLDHLPALIALGTVVSPVFSGVMASASAFAYRALVPPSEA